jgi:hypothetical protein
MEQTEQEGATQGEIATKVESESRLPGEAERAGQPIPVREKHKLEKG